MPGAIRMLAVASMIGACALGVACGPACAAAPVEIRMMSDTLGTKVWFDPIGVHIEPGQIVR